MAGVELVRIDPSSPVYQEVARLYRLAHDLHPGGEDLWNGELNARSDDKYGGLARDGSLRLGQDKVLRHLTGGEPGDDPQDQAQALATVLHEANHARAQLDAPHEPNAVRAAPSLGLNEGAIELRTMEDFPGFARRAGYTAASEPDPEYVGAVGAAGTLLDRAANSARERRDLLDRVADAPVAMGWDVIADSLVRTDLADVVPPDPEHQRAARAQLVNQMAIPEWDGVQHRPERREMVESLTLERLERGIQAIREHYRHSPLEPYPARVPNPQAGITVETDGEHQRANASTVRSARSAARQGEPTRFLEGSTPAVGAIRAMPVLGDGARGAGAPSPHAPSCGAPERVR